MNDTNSTKNQIGITIYEDDLYNCDMMWGTTANTVSVYGGSAYNTVASRIVTNKDELFQITSNGNIKIDDLEIDKDHFKTMLKYLLDITKEAKPEEFI